MSNEKQSPITLNLENLLDAGVKVICETYDSFRKSNKTLDKENELKDKLKRVTQKIL